MIKNSNIELTPLYHLLDKTVNKGSYSKQFLFKENNKPFPLN